MTHANQPPAASIRFSTDAFVERERLTAWREMFGRGIAKIDGEPLEGVPFHASMQMLIMPNLVMASGTATLGKTARTRTLVADGNDCMTFQITSCDGVASQFGREVTVRGGDGLVLSNSDVGTFAYAGASSALAFGLPRAAFGSLLRDPDAALVRPVPKDHEALRLLKGYAAALMRGPPTSENLQRLVADHVKDLVALALGATRDAAEHARTRGLSAARLHAAKAYAMNHLDQASLSATSIGAHLGVTARYIHMLFERTGMSVSEFVLAERLAHAHRMLTSPRHRGDAISTIAFEVGFTDLSHFNRAFRRRYRCTPSDVRMAARREQSDDGA